MRVRNSPIILSRAGSSSTIRILRPGVSISREYDFAMRFYTEYLTFQTEKHREYINITPEVETRATKERNSGWNDSGFRDAHHRGCMGERCRRGLLADIDAWLEKLAPFREDYRHHRTGETNGDSHLKSLLVHHEVIVPVTKGKLDFGPWQQVYYAEFDGQRAETRHH